MKYVLLLLLLVLTTQSYAGEECVKMIDRDLTICKWDQVVDLATVGSHIHGREEYIYGTVTGFSDDGIEVFVEYDMWTTRLLSPVVGKIKIPLTIPSGQVIYPNDTYRGAMIWDTVEYASDRPLLITEVGLIDLKNVK